MVEAGDGVGGTWHWNTYPGIAVDIPSFSYQFSFEQSPRLVAHLRAGPRAARRTPSTASTSTASGRGSGSTPRCSPPSSTTNTDLWRVQTDPGGEVTARFLINASGVLTVPKLPDIDGVDSFAGITMHTARWDHSQDLTGKRVAIIGTGASAVQVIPEIAPIVEQLTVFQRTPIWCFPKFDVPLPRAGALGDADSRRQGRAAAAQPGLRRADVPDRRRSTSRCSRSPRAMESAGLAYLRQQVDDPVVREQAHPAVRGRLQAARLPQHLSVHLQPRQRAAGHRADRQDHARRRWPPPTARTTRSTC